MSERAQRLDFRIGPRETKFAFKNRTECGIKVVVKIGSISLCRGMLSNGERFMRCDEGPRFLGHTILRYMFLVASTDFYCDCTSYIRLNVPVCNIRCQCNNLFYLPGTGTAINCMV
jgi:hypothetical protein